MEFAVLYNPLAGKGVKPEEALNNFLNGAKAEFFDVTKLDLKQFVSGLKKDVKIVLVGGDGTIMRFVNAVDCDSLKNDVYLFAAGNGNDFAADIGEDSPLMNEYIKNLPTVEVDGQTYKFINGVGFGIDGYCCEVGDKLKAAGKKVNYTSIAIKGLLFHFKPRGAVVTVDGNTYHFKKVWISPTMHGRMYGGGMIPTPDQKRNSGVLSVCVMYGAGKIKTLMAFPKIFKGEHVKKTKMVKILTGKEISVTFDTPCALQIDGETVLNVTKYTAKIG